MLNSTQSGISKTVIWSMSIISGLVVANNYYNQPLLGLIAKDFSVSESAAGKISVLTQLGYAFGLLLIVPLGDKFLRKKLILIDLVLVFAALLWMTFATELWMLYAASLLIGTTSVIPQLFVPIAAELSSEKDKAANIGLVVSGLLLGILLSRFVGGIVGELWGWRSMFGIAAGLMLLVWVFVYKMLPELQPNFKGTYLELMNSVLQLAKTQPVLQLASFRGAMAFGSMCALFTTLVFHMERPPFEVGASVVGSFGLAGAVGALAAAKVGSLQNKMSINRIILYALLILIGSWGFTYFAGNTYWGLIIGVILIDLGVQSSHIMNQTNYFLLKTNAVNRLNTVYMVSYFIGGSLGTFFASLAWQYAQWEGVCLVGITMGLLALIAHIIFSRKVSLKSKII
ncbi:Predicted arabinose efflux permease, MFS family [Chryseobacterium indoltheticum]|uniref:Inner membrane transport protein ynfM n=2 Tax=Chryseobacterium indoltheticum TaxID=254 RepID=A0A381FGH0_9FLAO|nr:MFS transporter [Chryseobacterium indoltheticum]SIQ08262.1 Predicted arabinose efflux permease, MFS family [Chryseobacterium indoltheticum]SUX45548.1 Inner membrane transport protein ynfM [Chryseobacterium indoltheticum]